MRGSTALPLPQGLGEVLGVHSPSPHGEPSPCCGTKGEEPPRPRWVPLGAWPRHVRVLGDPAPAPPAARTPGPELPRSPPRSHHGPSQRREGEERIAPPLRSPVARPVPRPAGTEPGPGAMSRQQRLALGRRAQQRLRYLRSPQRSPDGVLGQAYAPDRRTDRAGTYRNLVAGFLSIFTEQNEKLSF